MGWRYLVGIADANQAVAIADVRADETGHTTFSRLARGVAAQRLWDATTLANEHYRDRPEQFEFRIMDIPGLQTSALWLHSDQNNDVFIPIYSGNTDANKVHEEPSFIKDVVGAAFDYRERTKDGTENRIAEAASY